MRKANGTTAHGIMLLLFALAIPDITAKARAESESMAELREYAEQGDIEAQFDLGVMYVEGRDVPQDYQEALRWFRRAAEQGAEGAQYNLGVMHENGYGLPRDDEEAAHWRRRAMEQLLGPGPHIIPPWGASRHLRNLTKGGESQYVIEDDIPHLFKQTKATKKDPRKWLFVVGVEDYRTVADLSHSRHSAQWFAKAAAKVLGVTGERRIVLLDEDATGKAIKGRLARLLIKLKAGDQVYFYYSGHGIPVAEQGNAPYILPQDMTPRDVALDEAFRVENIYRKLTDSGVGQIIAFMDTCFTFDPNAGDESDGGEARARLVPAQPNVPEDGKLAVLMACREDQPSGDYAEQGHRMFSLFVIRELFKDHKRIGDLADEVSADITAVTMDLDDGKLRQDPTLQGNRLLEL